MHEIRREARKGVRVALHQYRHASKFSRFLPTIALQRLCLVSAMHLRVSRQQSVL